MDPNKKEGMDIMPFLNSALMTLLVIFVVTAFIDGKFISNKYYVVERCGNEYTGIWDSTTKDDTKMLDCVNRNDCDEFKSTEKSGVLVYNYETKAAKDVEVECAGERGVFRQEIGNIEPMSYRVADLDKPSNSGEITCEVVACSNCAVMDPDKIGAVS